MPLIKGKSPESFKKNIEIEMHHGKPQKQALAIAFSMKRKAQHKAMGGHMDPGTSYCAHGNMPENCPKCTYEPDSTSHNDPTEMAHMWGGGYADGGEPEVVAKGGMMKKKILGKMMAEGGQLTRDGYQDDDWRWHQESNDFDYVPAEEAEYDEEEYNKKHSMKSNSMAMDEDDRKLNQHGEDERGPYGHENHMADGGQITDNYSDEEDDDGWDMVDHLMKSRQKSYSEGGKVANRIEHSAGQKTSDYDDLVLRDDLDSDLRAEDTAANSGDELSDEQEDKDREDMKKMVMKWKAMKHGRMPASEKLGL